MALGPPILYLKTCFKMLIITSYSALTGNKSICPGSVNESGVLYEWVLYGGGVLEQEFRVDGGCFISASRLSNVQFTYTYQSCIDAVSICAEANSMLAYRRSKQDGTQGPLTWREFQKLLIGEDEYYDYENLDEYGGFDPYVCVTKHASYTPSKANIERSKKACYNVSIL